MTYDILKNLGLDALDPGSPEFLQTLDRLQREAWQSLQAGDPASAIAPGEDEVG